MAALLRLIGSVFKKKKLAALLGVSLISVTGCGKPAELMKSPAPGTVPSPAAVSDQTKAPEPVPVPAQPVTPGKVTSPLPIKRDLALVRVYYATDRSRTSQSEPAKIFGSKRSELSYGSCEVSIPRDQKLAKLEQPAVAKEAAREVPDKAPDKQAAVRKVSPREYESYLDSLRAAIAKSSQKSAFVFVHGYNVTFADAARRSAQLKYDLGFDGTAIFFSWPSKGRTDAYASDEADVEWAQPDLKEFLKDVAGKTKARNIYLIGHSMGNRALAKAYIYLISERPELKKVFREVILIAPDIDSDLFKRDIAPALAASSNRTTLYSSSRDSALRASSKFQDYPRAGDSGNNLLLFQGIETIDATNVNTALIRHSDVGDYSSVIADIYHLIRDGKKPGERSGLKSMTAASGQYWKFKGGRSRD
jgi:esterase/lipase superfamily enzyme